MLEVAGAAVVVFDAELAALAAPASDAVVGLPAVVEFARDRSLPCCAVLRNAGPHLAWFCGCRVDAKPGELSLVGAAQLEADAGRGVIHIFCGRHLFAKAVEQQAVALVAAAPCSFANARFCSRFSGAGCTPILLVLVAAAATCSRCCCCS